MSNILWTFYGSGHDGYQLVTDADRHLPSIGSIVVGPDDFGSFLVKGITHDYSDGFDFQPRRIAIRCESSP